MNVLPQERKHKDAQQVGEELNIGDEMYDRSCIVRMLCLQIAGLSEEGMLEGDIVGLRGPKNELQPGNALMRELRRLWGCTEARLMFAA